MNRAANWLELPSYAGVAAIGLWLVWRKGGALVAAVRRHFEHGRALASAPAYAGRRLERRRADAALGRDSGPRRRAARRPGRTNAAMSTRPTPRCSTARSPGATRPGR